MSGKINCLMKDGRNTIGKKDPSGAPVSVLLVGAGIQVNHSHIDYNPGTRVSTIFPNEDDPQKSKTTVNGELLTAAREL